MNPKSFCFDSPTLLNPILSISRDNLIYHFTNIHDQTYVTVENESFDRCQHAECTILEVPLDVGKTIVEFTPRLYRFNGITSNILSWQQDQDSVLLAEFRPPIIADSIIIESDAETFVTLNENQFFENIVGYNWLSVGWIHLVKNLKITTFQTTNITKVVFLNGKALNIEKVFVLLTFIN